MYICAEACQTSKAGYKYQCLLNFRKRWLAVTTLDVILQYVICVYTGAIHRHVPVGRQRICLFLVGLWEVNFSPYFPGRIIRFPLSKVAVMCYHASNVWAESAGERVPRSPPWDESSAWLKAKGVLVPRASSCSWWAKHPPCRLGILRTSPATSRHDKTWHACI